MSSADLSSIWSGFILTLHESTDIAAEHGVPSSTSWIIYKLAVGTQYGSVLFTVRFSCHFGNLMIHR